MTTTAESGHDTCHPHPIRRALDTALAQIEELMGEPFGTTPHLTIEDDPDFWALAEMRGEEFHVIVSNGVVGELQRLWDAALSDGACVTEIDGEARQPAAEDMVHVSLVWLILHELHHYDLGHFETAGTHYLAETPKAHRYALVTRIETPSSPMPKCQFPRPDSEIPLVQQLELQADADAIEMLLDAPSTEIETQDELRFRAACAGAVLILIDREERKVGSSGLHHPCAQLRIVQFLQLVHIAKGGNKDLSSSNLQTFRSAGHTQNTCISTFVAGVLKSLLRVENQNGII